MQAVSEIILSHSGKVYEDTHKNGTENETRLTHKRRIRIASLFGMLALIATFLQVILSGYTEFVELNATAGASKEYMYIPQIAWFWIVPLVLSLVWVVMFCTTVTDLQKNVQRRYENL